LFDEDIIKVFEHSLKRCNLIESKLKSLNVEDQLILKKFVDTFSEELVKKAYIFSIDTRRDGPFSLKGQIASKDPNSVKYYLRYFNKKLD